MSPSGGANDGKYYTTGSGIRTYNGGTITFTSSYNITKIEFTFSNDSYAPTSENCAVDEGSMTYGASGVWTGSAKFITFTSSYSHWRLQKVKVTY